MEATIENAPLLSDASLSNFPDDLQPSEEIESSAITTGTLPNGRKAPRLRQIIATLVSSLAPLSFGLVLGYSSPTIGGLKAEGILNDDSETWYTSVATLGALAGGVVGGFFISKIGRKGTLLACGVPFVIAWLMIIAVKLTKSFALLLVGRSLCGATMGVVCIAGPNYIAEIASADMRGALGTIFQVSTTIGVFLAFVMGIPLSWEWLAVACAVFAAAMSVLMFFVPETPRYLAAVGLDSQAMSSLRWLRGNSFDIEEEFDQIKEQMDKNPASNFSLRECTQKSVYKPVLLTLGLMVFQQCSGVNDVMFYTTEIFETAKFQGDPAIPGVIIGAVQVVATVASIFVMDRLGRRILLSISGTLMCIGCIALGVFYYLQKKQDTTGLGWLPICSLVLYIAAFSIGWGPIPWTMMAELIPSRVKGLASGLAVIVNWSCAFLVTKEFKDMENALTTYGTFWFLSGVNALGVIFVVIFLPETKGKSLEEIEGLFSENEFDAESDARGYI